MIKLSVYTETKTSKNT